MAHSVEQRINQHITDLENYLHVDHDISCAKVEMKTLGAIAGLTQEQMDRIANIIVRTFSGGLTDSRNGAHKYGSTPQEERKIILSVTVQCDNPTIITKIVEICTEECNQKLAVGKSWLSLSTLEWAKTVFSGSSLKIQQRYLFAQELIIMYDIQNRLGLARLGLSTYIPPEEMFAVEENIPEFDAEGNIITSAVDEELIIRIEESEISAAATVMVQIGDFQVEKSENSYVWTDRSGKRIVFEEEPTVAQLKSLDKPIRGKAVRVYSI